MGLSGILMNLIRMILIYIGDQTKTSGDDDPFINTLAFYIVNAVFNLISASMYFVERKNQIAKYVNSKVIRNNKAKPPVILKIKLQELLNSF